MSTRIAYITTARLPTEKAHGNQIAKMCEAFAERGAALSLIHPQRTIREPGLKGVDLFDAHGVQRVFHNARTPMRDLRALEMWLPLSIVRAVNLLSDLAWAHRAIAWAGRGRPEIYFTRDLTVGVTLTRRGLPFLFELHTNPQGFQKRLLRYVLTAPSLIAVLPLTAILAEEITGMIPPGDATSVVLPDGVDLGCYRELPSTEECRRLLGLPIDRAMVGFIGRFTALGGERGIPELIRAVGELSPRYPRLTLLCVGGPSGGSERYRAMARRAGLSEEQLILRDRVAPAEVPLWIRACSIVTLPSPDTPHYARYSSPLKLFEYMAAGMPIVASDLPALREVLTSEQNALLVRAGDTSALANGIGRLLADPVYASALGAQARSDAANYSWHERAGKVMRVYAERRLGAEPRSQDP